MPKRNSDKNIQQLLVFEYVINVSNGEDQTHFEIRRDVNLQLQRYYIRSNTDVDPAYIPDIIYLVINEAFSRRFVLKGSSKAYISNYRERNGSLIISFSLLVLGAISNYGSIRENVDYFSDDLERIFTSTLDNSSRDYNVSISVDESDSILLLNQDSNINDKRIDILSKKIQTNRVLFGITLFIALLLITIVASESSDKGDDNSHENDYKIQKMIKDEIRNEKIDEHLKYSKDTIYIKLK